MNPTGPKIHQGFEGSLVHKDEEAMGMAGAPKLQRGAQGQNGPRQAISVEANLTSVHSWMPCSPLGHCHKFSEVAGKAGRALPRQLNVGR